MVYKSNCYLYISCVLNKSCNKKPHRFHIVHYPRNSAKGKGQSFHRHFACCPFNVMVLGCLIIENKKSNKVVGTNATHGIRTPIPHPPKLFETCCKYWSSYSSNPSLW